MSKKLKFKYESHPPPICGKDEVPLFPGPVLRPILLATIYYPPTGEELRIKCVVDSGADISMFPEEVATQLGIPLRSVKKSIFGSPGSTIGHTAYRHDIVIDVAGYAFETPAGFVEGRKDSSPNILGQYGFFDNFSVLFNRHKKTFELTPKTSLPPLSTYKEKFANP